VISWKRINQRPNREDAANGAMIATMKPSLSFVYAVGGCHCCVCEGGVELICLAGFQLCQILIKCCKMNCSIYVRMHAQPPHKCTTPRKGITAPSTSDRNGGRYSPKVAPCYHVYSFAIELTFVILFQMLLDNQLCDLSSTNPCGTTRFMGTFSPSPFALLSSCLP
jgi:hypothetical protein